MSELAPWDFMRNTPNRFVQVSGDGITININVKIDCRKKVTVDKRRIAVYPRTAKFLSK